MERTASTPPPDDLDLSSVARLQEARTRLKAEIARVVVGQERVLDELLMALLCRGHVLMLGVPGLGKTLMAKTWPRPGTGIQPNPVHAGSHAFRHHRDGHRRGRSRIRSSTAQFFQGPLFTKFLLADEINRAPPKTQAALLQAMQEREVSVGRRTYKLDPPFFVVATQNPIEQEGTYPLPEAQLDRFMFNIPVIYRPPMRKSPSSRRRPPMSRPRCVPSSKSRRSSGSRTGSRGSGRRLGGPLCGEPRWCLTARIGKGPLRDRVQKFLTYGGSRGPRNTSSWVPRLARSSRANFHVDFADIRFVAQPVLRHRLVLNFQARAEGIGPDDLIKRLFELVRES